MYMNLFIHLSTHPTIILSISVVNEFFLSAPTPLSTPWMNPWPILGPSEYSQNIANALRHDDLRKATPVLYLRQRHKRYVLRLPQWSLSHCFCHLEETSRSSKVWANTWQEAEVSRHKCVHVMESREFPRTLKSCILSCSSWMAPEQHGYSAKYVSVFLNFSWSVWNL